MRTALLAAVLFVQIGAASAQCYPDRHNTSPNEGWMSCEMRDNPNPARERGHWIMYDLGYTYALGEMHVWNYNGADLLDVGAREIMIDLSNDGGNWREHGSFILNRASGKSRYEGETVTDFDGDTAKYVLISVRNNYGSSCSGLGEIKIGVLENVTELFTQGKNDCFKVALYPNPHAHQFAFDLTSECTGDVQYTLYDAVGRSVLNGSAGADAGSMNRTISTEGLSAGLYHLVVMQGGQTERFPLMKAAR